MKTRIGFVTNSSSSNFLIVGTTNTDLINELLKAENIDLDEYESSYGVNHDGKIVYFYGGYGEPTYAGCPIEDLMETMNLPQIKECIAEKIRENLNVEVSAFDLELFYGEVGDG